jgi:hypothetical protein
MRLTTEKEFLSLSKKERVDYLNYLINLKVELNEFFFDNLDKNQKKDYIENRIKTANWLHDYEFRIMSHDQKQRYIYRKRFLTNKEFLRLDDSLQEYYLKHAAYIKLQLSDNEFDILSNKMKKLYANFTFEFPLVLKVDKVKYLSKENQKKYIEKQMERGFSFPKSQYDKLPVFSQKYYEKMKKDSLINEIRMIVRNSFL